MDRDGAHSMCLRKRRKDAFEGGGYVPCRLLRLRNQMVSGEEHGDDRGLGLGLMSFLFLSNCQHHHSPFLNLN